MKKIVLYTSSSIGTSKKTGGVRRFLELVNNLGKYCELTLVSGDVDCDLPTDVKHISLNQSKRYNKEFIYALSNRKYLKKIRRQGYDNLIVFDVPPALWLCLYRMPHICLMIRKDLIGYKEVNMDEQGVYGIKRFFVKKIYSFAETITFLHSEKIIVQCEYDKEQLLNRHKFIKKRIENKIKVQINNVNPSWAIECTMHKKNETEQLVLGSVNGFSDLRKGCDIFLDAVKILVEEGIPVEAYIAGDGRLLSEYKQRYKGYPNIHFDGRILNPNEYIKQFDIAVVPSRADSCPNTVMEALYNSVPVLATKVGGIPEILKDQNCLFEPNANDLANTIKRIVNDPEMIVRIKNQQKNRKEELTFDWVEKIFCLIDG